MPYEISVTHDKPDALRVILAYAFANSFWGRGKGAAGWSTTILHDDVSLPVSKRKPRIALVFHYATGPKVTAFPAPISSDEAAVMASNWLKTADYGEGPDTDGDAKKGFIVLDESGARLYDNAHVIIYVAPRWTIYGK